ncbi:hypothetical protein MVEN_00119800 [Mycena venus]|uniref:Uncharacterized protein n=1 Tax=Mycena venus TaxID=2733690 RepID=A0A8H6Z932_9AGAR|nr:hypothetical protein MVEN_00119800 [Mycena venus]
MPTGSISTTLHFIPCARVLRLVAPLQLQASIPSNSRIGFKPCGVTSTVDPSCGAFMPIFLSLLTSRSMDLLHFNANGYRVPFQPFTDSI